MTPLESWITWAGLTLALFLLILLVGRLLDAISRKG
jgi:hypothetical protein